MKAPSYLLHNNTIRTQRIFTPQADTLGRIFRYVVKLNACYGSELGLPHAKSLLIDKLAGFQSKMHLKISSTGSGHHRGCRVCFLMF